MSPVSSTHRPLGPDSPMRRHAARALLFALPLALLPAGCATTQYAPQVVARGELTMRYQGGFEIYAGRERLSSGLTYPRLTHYVRCVPEAHKHAQAARGSGIGAVTTSIVGGTLGAAGLVGLIGLADQDRLGIWLGASLAASSVGLVFSIVGWRLKNHANGHAHDAVNFYNDAVGSLGATCDDLSYPAPAGDVPPLPLAPVPPPDATAPGSPAQPVPPGLPPPPTTL